MCVAAKSLLLSCHLWNHLAAQRKILRVAMKTNYFGAKTRPKLLFFSESFLLSTIDVTHSGIRGGFSNTFLVLVDHGDILGTKHTWYLELGDIPGACFEHEICGILEQDEEDVTHLVEDLIRFEKQMMF